jgi:hypothetical protein
VQPTNKKTPDGPNGPTAAKRAYYRARKQLLVTFIVDDPILKEVLKETADADGRSVNSWMRKYILPKLEDEMDQQLAKMTPARRDRVLAKAKKQVPTGAEPPRPPEPPPAPEKPNRRQWEQ